MTELATWADARLSDLVDSAHGAILDRIPMYRETDIVPYEDLHQSIANNLGFMIGTLATVEAPLDLAAPRETGRRRAHQGVPLPEVLRAYRICFSTMWDALLQRSNQRNRPGDSEALLDAASRIWQVTDEHAVALTESYRSTTAELLVAHQERRSALVEALLSGRPSADAGQLEAASLLDLPSDAMFVVVAAETRGLAEGSLPSIERHLASQGVVSAWRLTPALQLGVVALTTEQREQALTVIRSHASCRTGISPEFGSLIDTPRALQLAKAALAMVPAGRTATRIFSASPLAALVARSPEESRRVAERVLGPVLELAAEDRLILLDTLTEYFDHGASAEAAAKHLHCHANTVRYRLRRITELTHRSLSEPLDIAELTAAAYAIQLSPELSTPEPPRKRR